jgi:cation diffusion facilitator family transporter
MDDTRQKIAEAQIKSVTTLAIITNILLFVIKILVGFLAGSIALIADGLHSLSDMTTDLAVLLGVHFAAKKPDSEHPYGHGRVETFSAGFIALVLLFVGGGMIYYAAVEIAKGTVIKLGYPVLIVAALSVIIKETLYRISKKVAVKFHSPALYANAWHQRSDALSSVAVLIGFVALRFGFAYGDQIAAVAVGLMIILVAAKMLGQCLSELTERAVEPDTIEHIKTIINANSQIRQWHKLRSRTVGREIFLDLHILVDPLLDIATAHEIAETLESSLHQQMTRPINITIHVEPDLPELRK